MTRIYLATAMLLLTACDVETTTGPAGVTLETIDLPAGEVAEIEVGAFFHVEACWLAGATGSGLGDVDSDSLVCQDYTASYYTVDGLLCTGMVNAWCEVGATSVASMPNGYVLRVTYAVADGDEG